MVTLVKYMAFCTFFQVCILSTISSERLEKRSFDAEGSGSIPDLDYIHDTQFCTDVSAWSEVEWMGMPMQKCNTTFGKDRKTKREMVR